MENKDLEEMMKRFFKFSKVLKEKGFDMSLDEKMRLYEQTGGDLPESYKSFKKKMAGGNVSKNDPNSIVPFSDKDPEREEIEKN